MRVKPAVRKVYKISASVMDINPVTVVSIEEKVYCIGVHFFRDFLWVEESVASSSPSYPEIILPKVRIHERLLPGPAFYNFWNDFSLRKGLLFDAGCDIVSFHLASMAEYVTKGGDVMDISLPACAVVSGGSKTYGHRRCTDLSAIHLGRHQDDVIVVVFLDERNAEPHKKTDEQS